MNHKLLLCTYLSLLVIANASAQFYNWNDSLSYYIENPAVFEEGQEESRAYFIPSEHQLLNGNWKFYWTDTPDKLPDNFYTEKFDDKKWDNIQVPSNWEMMGYGDKLFRNISASFKPNPPLVPKEYNPTGIYRRTFNIPAEWKDKEIFLRFEKVSSASFVWINGKKIGYNEGAHEPSEYNITEYIRKGKNQLTVCVLKYSDGYYLEMQDYWRLSGIFEDVLIYATPLQRLFDYQVITDLDENYTHADLKINAWIKNYRPTDEHAKYLVKARLKDKEGETLYEFESPIFQLKDKETSISLDKEIKNPSKWTAETPDLYQLELQLQTEDKEIIDNIDTRIGFKETEIKEGVFYLNGAPLKLHAQNSHMQHPETGHSIDEATIRKDFEILKQFNFNAVRTSHYPPTNKYVELANEYGLYIIDEVGDEAHSTEWLSDRAEYAEMYKERCRRLVLRDRNHPCVLFWSAGNESGEGENIRIVIEEGKKLDPTRYWMYGGNAFSHPAEDIIGPRYPTPMELEVHVGLGLGSKDRRPSFMDEYLSVAGNGGGGLDDYWKVIYAHPRLMGGAIWDFVSPGVTDPVRQIKDSSPHNTPAHLMGNASLVAKEKHNSALDLNGHDQWVEVYRNDNVEITGEGLTINCKIFPRSLISNNGSLITKGNNQFGIEQRGKDFVEFYIYTDKKHTVKAQLPDNWENHWHQLTAVYDGKEMAIYIDKEKKAVGEASGSIRNFPFSINIGRNAEIHGQETSVYICDALFDEVAIFNKALPIDSLRPEEACCWFDFESEVNTGIFFSYGIGARTYGSIWPDRSVQPEMWQMKKSAQPLSFKMIESENGQMEVWNRNHFLNASIYKITWSLLADDKVVQEGIFDLKTEALSKEIIRIPYNKPLIERGKEYRIQISSCLKEDCIWAKAGHEVAWEQLELDWYLPEQNAGRASTERIDCKETEDKLYISGGNYTYTFDKVEGRLIRINYGGQDLLESGLSLNLWHAPLANELDDWNSGSAQSGRWKEGFGHTVATEMYSAGVDKLMHQPISFSHKQIDNRVYVYITDIELMGSGGKEKKDLYIEGVQCNGIKNEYEFVIDADGQMEIKHKLSPEGRMPLWLPRIGISFVMNKDFDRINWYGRGPQENYPDRKSGYKIGIYNTTVDEMYEPYLIPQDYGLRTDNRWLRATNEKGIGIEFKMDYLFNFNAYPYSTDNLTKAVYPFQLKRQNGITVNLDYATSGVGCTARGIFDSYKAMPVSYERSITINPISP